MYIYSAKNNAFYLESMKEDYISANTWPDDGLKVANPDFVEFATAAPPKGKRREAGADGLPAWADIPAPTREQNEAYAASVKAGLLSQVNEKTGVWQTQLTLGIITDADKATLISWMKYAQAISAVDVTAAPDIEWPEIPA